MVLPDAPVSAALTAAVSVWFILFGVSLYRRSEDIGAGSLSAFAVALGTWSLLDAVVVTIVYEHGVTDGLGLATLSVPTPVELFLLATTPLSGLLLVAAVFSWLWFVLTYTVRIDREEKLAVLALGGAIFVVATFNGLIGALAVFDYVALPPLLESQVHRFAGLIEILGTGVGVGAGIAQLYRSSRHHGSFSRRTAIALSVPILLPYLTRYLYQFGLITTFRHIGVLRLVSLSVAFVGLWIAVERYGAFERLPASRTVGRETAFETAEAAIAVLNDDDRIVDLNPTAEALFDTEASEVIGEPATTVLPAETLDAPDGTTYEFPNEDTIVEAQTTATVDERGREIGRTIVYADITGERRRQQRIEVLNRVLRHNLRNDANAAAGYVDMAAERDPEEAERYADVAHEMLDGLVEVGAKAREMESMLAADPFGETVSLATVVENGVSDAREGDERDVSVSVPDGVTTTVNPRLLRPVVAELVENAVKHTSAAVEVRFNERANALIVADEGPGIPEHEIEVFDEGETPLKHGSGLGLWLVKWGVARFGGEVRFDVDDSGSRVAVLLPSERVEGA